MACPEELKEFDEHLETSADDDSVYIGTFPLDMEMKKFDGRYELLVADKRTRRAYRSLAVLPASGPVLSMSVYDYFCGKNEKLMFVYGFPPIEKGREPDMLKLAYRGSYDEALRLLNLAMEKMEGKNDACKFIDNDMDILRSVFRKQEQEAVTASASEHASDNSV